ncbi:hypothetical protein BCON_0113g00190 [Botryotinia convoluta]|uniref:Uncharacterized protein n=1 Tax=Botryotinia convoluta TaxID=54673 RepID=A0A4Z1HXT5_9HELO|nr:hypothetical protein BCON_0113g00190 [Botryotinia convoluta]
MNSELCRKGRRFGVWRAVADISEAMRQELGPDICAYTEDELAASLKVRRPIKYYARLDEGGGPGYIGSSPDPSTKIKLLWDAHFVIVHIESTHQILPGGLQEEDPQRQVLSAK